MEVTGCRGSGGGGGDWTANVVLSVPPPSHTAELFAADWQKLHFSNSVPLNVYELFYVDSQGKLLKKI